EDSAVIGKLRLHVADTLGALVAATATAEGKALIRFRRQMQSFAGAASMLDDIALYCALARLSEVDDIHLASMITPGSIVIPAALALAAHSQACAVSDVAAAIVGGYEAMIRLGRTINGPAILYRGIWPTYFAAAFGTAAVAARLLQLTDAQAAQALAWALNVSAPSVGQHHSESTARWLSVGHAARNGVMAALAARAGFTADRELMRSRFMSDIYGIEPDLAAMTDGLGERVALAEVSFKPWCAARQTMAATQASREFVEGGTAPEQIVAITAAVPPPHFRMVNHGVEPGDRASFITSLPYQMAVAVLQTGSQLDLAPAPGMPSPALQALMTRITVMADERLLANYPLQWPASVTFVTAHGRYEREISDVPGDPARPLSEARLTEKFQRLVAPVLGQGDPLWQSALDALRSAQALNRLVARLDEIVRTREVASA
ncbi:MAG: MmgE/PrpD family protein, partial [Bradyrhizobiaceae bacterium]|nr:MmgE/PrpD family protein [Bradyrhizobiaceae bacterium]